MPYADPKDTKDFRKRYKASPNGKINHARGEKKYAAKLRLIVIKHYCGEDIRCQCLGCHTTDICFLQVDHIDGKGHSHRIGVNRAVGKALWLWIIKNNFPQGFQILCSNCNYAKKCGPCCPMTGKKH
jgi:hypothetical protein